MDSTSEVGHGMPSEIAPSGGPPRGWLQNPIVRRSLAGTAAGRSPNRIDLASLTRFECDVIEWVGRTSDLVRLFHDLDR